MSENPAVTLLPNGIDNDLKEKLCEGTLLWAHSFVNIGYPIGDKIQRCWSLRRQVK